MSEWMDAWLAGSTATLDVTLMSIVRLSSVTGKYLSTSTGMFQRALV